MTAANLNSNVNGSLARAIGSQHDAGKESTLGAIATADCQVVHRTAGRYRLRIPRLSRDPDYVRQLSSVLKQLDFVKDVRINPSISSAVITYTTASSRSIAEIESRLLEAIQMNALPSIVESSEPSEPSELSSSPERISQLLQRFLEQHPGDEIRLRDLLDELGDRAFGPTLLICALPEALPLPIPGISALVAMPLMLVSGQLVLGFQQPWLPNQLLDHPLKREHCGQIINAAIPFLKNLERFVEPRWSLFTSPAAERGVGVMVLFLSFIIALPIPFGNMLPAIVIVLICLGLVEKDGLVIAISAMVTGITPALLLLV